MDGPERNYLGGRLQSHNSQIVIHQPVSVALFFKLLQTPQRWRDRYDTSAEPEILAGSRAVDFIIVEEKGALIHSSEEAIDIVQTENTVDTLCIQWRADTTPDETRNTFRALANLTPNARSEATPQDYPAVKFQIEAGPAVDAWIDAVSHVTSDRAELLITFVLALFHGCSPASGYDQPRAQGRRPIRRFQEIHAVGRKGILSSLAGDRGPHGWLWRRERDVLQHDAQVRGERGDGRHRSEMGGMDLYASWTHAGQAVHCGDHGVPGQRR